MRFRNDYQALIDGLNLGVRNSYSETELLIRLQHLSDSGLSLREIATLEFYGKVSHGTVQRALKRQFPKSKKIRDAMGLPALAHVPACPDCGAGHAVGWCTERYGEPARPRSNSRPRKPPWYALQESYADEGRMSKVYNGWTED